MATKAAVKKTRVTAKHVAAHRANSGRDFSPKWDGCETWDTNTFYKHFRTSMDWYRMESSGKDLKPKVINWMSANGFTKDQIKAFKDTKDWRSNLTMGAVAACLLKGMPACRSDFNNGKNTAQWLSQQINSVIEAGKDDVPEEVEDKKDSAPVVTIQDRVREATFKMTEEIEDAIESFSVDPEAFDPKSFKLVNLLRGKQVKAAHARIIKDYYQRQHDEYVEVLEGKCEQLKEAYSHRTKGQIKKIFTFHQEILSACDMLMQEAKINRKPRKVKAVSKDKIIAKMKYAKTHEQLKLVSVNPVDIIGSKELWVYNTKTRKLGKYIAEDFKDLSIKGTSITGFSESKSVQKTLRKPEDQLKEFKNAGKVALRKFLEDIKAVDIKLNGRINEDTVLLKVS